MEKELNKGASFGVISNAKELRKSQTKTEEILWNAIRNRKLNGLKFRRQHPIGSYILDFYCHDKKLGIEIDGEVHSLEENIEYDNYRTYELNELDIKVIRFSNNEVLDDLEKVKLFILKAITVN